MEFTASVKDRTDEIVTLFNTAFAAHEGEAEGRLIGQLVKTMLSNVGSDNIHVYSAVEGEVIVGTAIFTRMTFAQDGQTVFILSPLAVIPAQQGRGVGQKLLRHALNGVREKGVDVVLTYGDIHFYSRVGFSHLSATQAPPPLPLRYPEGWLGQSLTDRPLGTLKGPSTCVETLNDPKFW